MTTPDPTSATPGKKFDADKAPLLQGCLAYFPKALFAVASVSAYGAKKYAVPYHDRNWMRLKDAFNRYGDGDARHLVYEHIDGLYDPESQLLHAAHHAWNALARLELLLDTGVSVGPPSPPPTDSQAASRAQSRRGDAHRQLPLPKL